MTIVSFVAWIAAHLVETKLNAIFESVNQLNVTFKAKHNYTTTILFE